MEQRPLRLGDIVDDYCPRERRVTNHAIVAIVEDVIRQTRCSTCDTEHVYKAAREPRLRKKPGSELVDERARPGAGETAGSPPAAESPVTPVAASGETNAPDGDPPPVTPSADADDRGPDAWLAHRQLIRATLPRSDTDQPTPRPIPEFTMHRQAYGRPFRGHGRHGHSGASNGFDHDRQGNGNDNRGNHGNHGNFGNGSPGNGQPRPAGGGRRRRRRGGRHKQSH
jgi:hypothetical protein